MEMAEISLGVDQTINSRFYFAMHGSRVRGALLYGSSWNSKPSRQLFSFPSAIRGYHVVNPGSNFPELHISTDWGCQWASEFTSFLRVLPLYCSCSPASLIPLLQPSAFTSRKATPRLLLSIMTKYQRLPQSQLANAPPKGYLSRLSDVTKSYGYARSGAVRLVYHISICINVLGALWLARQYAAYVTSTTAVVWKGMPPVWCTSRLLLVLQRG